VAENARLFMNLKEKDATGAPIKGEVAVLGFVDQIELDDWNWTLGRKKVDGKPADTGAAASGSDVLGKLTPSVLSFSKPMDRSTPVMLSMMESGKLAHATITLEEASDAEFEMTIELEHVRIIEYEVEGEVQDDSGEVKEKWVFNYKTIKFTYLPNKTDDKAPAGARVAVLERDPGDSTEKPGGDKDVETFKQLALKLGQKTAKTLFEGITWQKPAEAPADFKASADGQSKK
jgi:type VI protein secretion system component Hcp